MKQIVCMLTFKIFDFISTCLHFEPITPSHLVSIAK